MNHDIPLGHIRGIRVGMSWSVVLIAGFYVYILATYQFPNEVWGAGTTAYWAAGIAGALAFFASLLVHEMSHALVARRAGIGVRGITLWLLGGFAELDTEPRTPGKQFAIAAVGPISNLVLAVAFWIPHLLVDNEPDPFAVHMGAGDLPGVVLGWLAFVNLLLGLFNLLPAAPLDGGQIFGALVWAASGKRAAGRRWAAYAGVALGAGGVAYGLVTMSSDDSMNGIWLMVIGWWIISVALADLRRSGAERSLSPFTVGQLMRSNPPIVSAQSTIDSILSIGMPSPPPPAFCAQGPDGRIVGLLTASQIRNIDPVSRANVPLGQLAFPIDRVLCLPVGTNALEVAHRIEGDSVGQALVLQGDGRVVGTIGVAEIDAHLRAHRPTSSGR